MFGAIQFGTTPFAGLEPFIVVQLGASVLVLTGNYVPLLSIIGEYATVIAIVGSYAAVIDVLGQTD
jgi:hypothetical protein